MGHRSPKASFLFPGVRTVVHLWLGDFEGFKQLWVFDRKLNDVLYFLDLFIKIANHLGTIQHFFNHRDERTDRFCGYAESDP